MIKPIIKLDHSMKTEINVVKFIVVKIELQ